jgi:hypothetical protein
MKTARKKKTPAAPTGVLGWWFSASDELRHGDGRKVVIGETLTVEGKIVPCERGLHASVDPFDALRYAPGPMLYRVRLSGEVVVHDGDKHVASEHTALAVRDATDMLRDFARKQALTVIHLWDAPAIVREYLETGDESKRDAARDAARAGAWDAAWAAAWAAARAAAWDAARDAARAAARDAAWAAARAAARDAAWAAARDAARDAAWAAARAAARDAAWAAARDAAWAAARDAAWAAARADLNSLLEGILLGAMEVDLG